MLRFTGGDWPSQRADDGIYVIRCEADAGRAKDHATKQRALGVLVNGRELVCAVQVIKHDKRFALVMGVEPVQDLSSPLAVNPFWNASPGVSCMQVLSDELEAASNQHHHHLFTGQVFAPSAADHVLRAL
ncbi:hypothetical protein ASD35_03085 [Pelomonas sp. Root1444]|nr:hypothetical protein ASD35_03085 [Pelomonas sp. Root1444]